MFYVEAQAADPLHPELTWELQSDYVPTTVGIYANPDVYEENGEPVYQGYRIAEVELTQPEDVAGDPFIQAVDCSRYLRISCGSCGNRDDLSTFRRNDHLSRHLS